MVLSGTHGSALVSNIMQIKLGGTLSQRERNLAKANRIFTFTKLCANILLLGPLGIGPGDAFFGLVDIAEHELPVGVGHVGLDRARDLRRL